MGVGFNSTKDSDVVVVDEAASVNPFAPILVGIDSTGVLEGKTECCWLLGVGDRCQGVAPGVGGEGCLICWVRGLGAGSGEVSTIDT